MKINNLQRLYNDCNFMRNSKHHMCEKGGGGGSFRYNVVKLGTYAVTQWGGREGGEGGKEEVRGVWKGGGRYGENREGDKKKISTS